LPCAQVGRAQCVFAFYRMHETNSRSALSMVFS
jgi:hypothetical protein